MSLALPSRNGGPMNIYFQDYMINKMAIAQDLEEFLQFEALDIDPMLRLPENWERFKNSYKDFIF
ncbi:hypothetical protein [Candidatus Lokiarchaeum ossiferum]|uniref:hypothetical protein n=1 Tax=Candidatus Lokiarchaeum ossiferum TaxID=2951803 RepID=UPI00352DF6B0